MHTASFPVPPRLLKASDALRRSDPRTQATGYPIEAWRQQFGSDGDLEALHSSLGGRISRGDVFKLAAKAIADSREVRRFFIGAMLWGFGSDGDSTARTSEMLSHPEAVDRFYKGMMYILDGDIGEACLFFRDPARGALSEFDWPFITKFLYFVGVASDRAQMPPYRWSPNKCSDR